MNTPPNKLTISLGADHGGVDTKDGIAEHLRQKGYNVVDRGTHGHDSVDYPNFAKNAQRVVHHLLRELLRMVIAEVEADLL